jgi:hypothetical protein
VHPSRQPLPPRAGLQDARTDVAGKRDVPVSGTGSCKATHARSGGQR